MRSFQHPTFAAGLMLAAAACSTQPTTIEAGQSPDAEAAPDDAHPTTIFEIPTTTGPPQAPGDDAPEGSSETVPLDGHDSAITTIAPADDVFTTDTTTAEPVFTGDTNSPYCEKSREQRSEFKDFLSDGTADPTSEVTAVADGYNEILRLAPPEIRAEIAAFSTLLNELRADVENYDTLNELTDDYIDVLSEPTLNAAGEKVDEYNRQVCDVTYD